MSKRKRRTKPPSERRAGPAAEQPDPHRVNQLREAHKVIDPHQVFRLELAPGEFFETTGAEMIETADAYTALVDAQRSGDLRALRKAVERIEKLP